MLARGAGPGARLSESRRASAGCSRRGRSRSSAAASKTRAEPSREPWRRCPARSRRWSAWPTTCATASAPAAELILLPDGGELKPENVDPILAAFAARSARRVARIDDGRRKCADKRSSVITRTTFRKTMSEANAEMAALLSRPAAAAVAGRSGGRRAARGRRRASRAWTICRATRVPPRAGRSRSAPACPASASAAPTPR